MNEPGFIKYVADRGLRTSADAAKYFRKRSFPATRASDLDFIEWILRHQDSDWHLRISEAGNTRVGGRRVCHSREFRGQGYAYEAALAVMNYGRTTLELPRIVGVTAPDNRVSMRLLEKLGLRFRKKLCFPATGRRAFCSVRQPPRQARRAAL